MSVKTSGVGHFQIPTAPAAGTSCTSGAANVYTTTYVQLIASTAAALYITGLYVEEAGVTAGTYISVQLATGAAASETIVGQYLVAPVTGSTVTRTYRAIFPPIPVAISTRIAVKTADSVGAQAKLISLECIAQSNVVDDAIAVTTVTTVTNQLTAAAVATGVWQDAVAGDFTVASSIGKALQITNVVPGEAGGHMISGVNAGTTTLGALTVTGATTHTGNMVLSDGLTISAPSTLNRAGFDIAGNGTGAAVKATGGATGIGLNVIGGGTSGDGIKVTTTSGHGLNLAPVGTNMHGFLSTGGNGGVSDGVKAAAGTGGVDFRANQTGNLTGTVATLTTYTGNTLQTGDSFARLGAAGAGLTALGDARIANLDATVSSRLATAGYTAPTNLTAAQIATGVWTDATAGDFTAALSVGKSVMNGVALGTGLTIVSVSGAVGSVTGAVGSVAGLTAANLDTTVSSRLATAGYTAPPTAADNATAVLTTAMTESYRANAAAPTLAQAQFETIAHLGEAAIVGVTKTINKIDHVTAAETFTLDSATDPATITRAT